MDEPDKLPEGFTVEYSELARRWILYKDGKQVSYHSTEHKAIRYAMRKFGGTAHA